MITPSLNTLAFPEWSLPQVVAFARQNDVPYFEIRALENNLDLLSLPDFASPARITQSRLLLHTSGVRVLSLNLGFHLTDDLTAQADTIRHYAALADSLGAPYLRFFPGGDPAERPDIGRLARGALQAINLITGYEVQLLIETHDSLVHSDDILGLNDLLEGHLNLLWDIAHTANFGGEPWQETVKRLEPVTCYLHIKNTRRVNGKIQNAPLFEGDLDVRGLLNFLSRRSEETIVSFEWEKMWDPTLSAGDEATLEFLNEVRALA